MQTEALTTTLRIPTENMPVLLEKFGKFSKRAAKSGASIALTKLYTLTINRLEYPVKGLKPVVVPYEYQVVEVASPAVIRIENWTLLGTIDRTHSEPVMYAAPNASIPTVFRDSQGVCEHCNKKRSRKETFVLQHDNGRVMQVGRNCLADFISLTDVKQALATYEALRRWAEECRANESEFGSRDRTELLMNFLPMAARVIRANGWTSSSAARAYNASLPEESGKQKVATVSQTWQQLSPLSPCEIKAGVKRLEIEDQDMDVAEAAVVWAFAQEGNEDYIRNCRIIAKDGWFKPREAGLAASIVGSYFRAQGWGVARAAAAAEKAEAPDVPEGRYNIKGKVLKLETKWSDYGSRLVMVVKDERGFCVWGTCPWDLDVGAEVEFKATVTRSDSDPKFGFFKRPV